MSIIVGEYLLETNCLVYDSVAIRGSTGPIGTASRNRFCMESTLYLQRLRGQVL